jgi:hypothetical protein
MHVTKCHLPCLRLNKVECHVSLCFAAAGKVGTEPLYKNQQFIQLFFPPTSIPLAGREFAQIHVSGWNRHTRADNGSLRLTRDPCDTLNT